MEEQPINYYSPNDYIYQFVDSSTKPPDAYCTNPENTVSCGNDITSKTDDQKTDCIKKEYCINKNNEKYDVNRANAHLGAEGRFLDIKKENKDLLETTVCYSIGLLGVVVFLFLHRK